MFGQNSVQSTWGSNQQQQPAQPQQGTGAFGQPSTFGSTNTFGSTGTFGQPQGQQQQPANPMFGGLGGGGTSTGTTGFGAFGGSNTNNQNSAFGAKPNTGFGAFGGGGTSAFGSTTTFGTNNTSTTTPATSTLFGQPSTSSTGAFGSTTTFGAPKPAGFGSTPSQGGDGAGPVTTGSLNPPYSVFSEKDAQNSTLMIQYQAITCMPAYRGTSFEEIRMQDYSQGRKTSTAATGGTFGQTPAFGPTTNNAFGQPAQPAANPFGSTSTTSTNTTAPAQTTGFGAFGQPAQPAAASGFGAFGQTQQPPQQQQPQQPQATGFGAFGQQASQPSTGNSLFGGNAFGQNKPTFGGFGTTTATGTNTFGTTGTNAFGTTGTNAFGTTQPQQPQQTGTFGQTTQPANTGFGAFGTNTANTNKPLFGQPAQPTQPATTGFGAFGQPAQQNTTQGTTQPAPFGSTSLFGNTTNTGGIFGQNAQQPQNQTPAAGFGSTTGTTTGFGGNLFGNTNQQPQQQQPNTGFGTFGKPAAPAGQTSLFGGFGQTNSTQNTAPTGNLFGSVQPTSQPSGGFGNLFGAAKPAPAAGTTPSGGLGSIFGGNNAAQNAANASTLGTNGTQGTLTASINQPIGSNLPIFSMLPPGPRAVTLDQSQSKKKVGFFVDVPTRSPVPRVQLGGFTPATSKLRGFGSSTSTSFSPGISFSSGKPNALSLSKQPESLTPDVLLGGRASPSLGSGERRSVKKLILDKKVEATDLFSRAGSTSPGLRGKVTFSPALSIAAREKDATTFSSPAIESPSPATRTQRATNRFTAGVADGEVVVDSKTLKEGDYWSKPDLQTLMGLGHAELRSCKDLVVGRVGYGEVHFLEPVDLTGLSKLSQLYGDVIRFDDKECSVYPEVDEAEKPPVGTHLNVHARITLIRCWVNDKATREPIKTETHPMMVKHLKKLKNMRDTKFESFEAEEGKWVFTVEHF